MPKIQEAAEYSLYNRDGLEQSVLAGCYYCLEVYPATEVSRFIDDGKTALCPMCGIDSVLPGNAGFPLTHSSLLALKAFWFGVDDVEEPSSCPVD